MCQEKEGGDIVSDVPAFIMPVSVVRPPVYFPLCVVLNAKPFRHGPKQKRALFSVENNALFGTGWNQLNAGTGGQPAGVAWSSSSASASANLVERLIRTSARCSCMDSLAPSASFWMILLKTASWARMEL